MLLETPISTEIIKKLKLQDVVYINGIVYTARDKAHVRAIEYFKQNKTLPESFTSMPIFHCGPIVEKKNHKWNVVCAGPTTSTRMNTLEPEFIKYFKPSCVIGKGGMSNEVAKAMKEHCCTYLSITGGAAVLAAKGIVAVETVHWYDLGMAEALWKLEVKNFGPLIVTIDANGNNYHELVASEVRKNLEKIKLCIASS